MPVRAINTKRLKVKKHVMTIYIYIAIVVLNIPDAAPLTNRKLSRGSKKRNKIKRR